MSGGGGWEEYAGAEYVREDRGGEDRGKREGRRRRRDRRDRAAGERTSSRLLREPLGLDSAGFAGWDEPAAGMSLVASVAPLAPMAFNDTRGYSPLGFEASAGYGSRDAFAPGGARDEYGVADGDAFEGGAVEGMDAGGREVADDALRTAADMLNSAALQHERTAAALSAAMTSMGSARCHAGLRWDDVFLYAFSGLLLLFIMEQFLQVGMLLADRRAARV